MEFTIKDINSIHEIAREFLKALGDSRVLAFYGSMGTGKTTFIKALCEVLGVDDVITSPTFAIVNEYTAGITDTDGCDLAGIQPNTPIYHFDFYRIKKLEEVLDMGYEDYVYGGALCLMEWPELIEDILPDDVMKITITHNDDESRTVSINN